MRMARRKEVLNINWLFSINQPRSIILSFSLLLPGEKYVNLINTPWIPVVRASGLRESIAPWQLAGPADDPPVALDYTRPDLAAGMLEFLIGLVQTCSPPTNKRQWKALDTQPPDAEDLRRDMNQHAHAFELFGQGPCFMQDLEMLREQSGKTIPISALFIDSCGAIAVGDNTDFFVKRGRINHLCPACAAAAIFTMQAFAPSGGQGHRTSLRGGGPLSTTILGDTLWQSVWRNVLPMERLQGLGNMEKDWKGGVFPWLAPTVTSEKGVRATMPVDVHPLHMYWGMPRRFRLIPLGNDDQAVCDICQTVAPVMFAEYATLPRGYNYEGGFCHPLSPTVHDAEKEPYHVHGSPTGVRYRNWLGLVNVGNGRVRREPALVVSAYRQRSRSSAEFRILARGYDMDNMKPRAWNQGAIPVYEVPEELRQDYAVLIAQCIGAADEVGSTLRKVLRTALFDPRADIKANNTLLGGYTTRFWQDTEAIFYVLLLQLRDCLREDNEIELQEYRTNWLRQLCKKARDIFQDAAQMWQFSADDDHRRLAKAWRDLLAYASVRNNKLRDLLELPKIQKEPKTGTP